MCFYRVKEKAFEAQVDTARFKRKLDIVGPKVWYLGLFRVEAATVEMLHHAQNRATQAIDRCLVKLLEGLISEEDLQKELHVRLLALFACLLFTLLCVHACYLVHEPVMYCSPRTKVGTCYTICMRICICHAEACRHGVTNQ